MATLKKCHYSRVLVAAAVVHCSVCEYTTSAPDVHYNFQKELLLLLSL